MVWRADKHGLIEYLDLPVGVIQKMIDRGEKIYATPVGVAIDFNIPLTAFTGPIHAVPYYDSAEVFANNMSTKGLAPCEIRYHAKIEYFDGEVHNAPLHLEDVRAQYSRNS